MIRSLKKFFLQLEDSQSIQEEICGIEEGELSFRYEQADIDFLVSYFSGGIDSSRIEGAARRLFEISPNAFDLFLHAWLGELQVEKETVSFGRRILATAEGAAVLEQKKLAQKAASDMGDSDTLAVHNTVFKVQREIDRMRGLLRFFPEDDRYAARCATDHFVLPALAPHFTARFGDTPWAIFDERRGLCLSRLPHEGAKIVSETQNTADGGGDEWEELWRHYHSTINNEQRNNPNLQRQFMPKRYWKYLPEIRNQE